MAMVANKRDYYKVLGVGRKAGNAEIKQAYRRLAREYHPDVNKKPDAESRFREINEAYEVLSDEQKRTAYNLVSHAGTQVGFAADFSGFDGIFDGVFDGVFSQFAGARGDSQRRVPVAADLRYPETCAMCYGTGIVPSTTPRRCSTCNGNGQVRRVQQSILGAFVNVTTCPTCHGETIIAIPCSIPCSQCGGRGMSASHKSNGD
jgi:molecular chaperone DnaJ